MTQDHNSARDIGSGGLRGHFPNTTSSTLSHADRNAPVNNPRQTTGSQPASQPRPKVPLKQRLPEGVYENRPRYKRYVLHWLYFWAYARLRLYKLPFELPVPRASYAEQIVRDGALLKESRKALHLVDVFAGEKGGVGKTTNAMASSAIEADVTQSLVLVFDNNQTRGTTASACGVTETLTVRQLIEINERSPELLTTDWLTAHLGEHPVYGNLFVVDSDEANDRKRYPVISEDKMLRLFEALEKCFSRVSIDQGNNPEMPAQVAAIKRAKVLRFVLDPAVDRAIQNCMDTMSYCRDIVPDKVKNSVLIVSAHRRSDPPASYYAGLFDLPEEQVVLIPFEPNLKPPMASRANRHILTEEQRLAEMARLTRPIILNRYSKRYRCAVQKGDLVARQMAAKDIAKGVVMPVRDVPAVALARTFSVRDVPHDPDVVEEVVGNTGH